MSTEADELAATGRKSERYTSVAITLHWLIAVLVVVALGIGIYGSDVEGDAGKTLIDLHKLAGLSVLALTLARVGWRLRHRPPPLPPIPRHERLLARLVHGLFYVLLLVLPLSGWLLTSSFPGRHPIVVGDLTTIPFLPVSPDLALAQTAYTVHEIGGWMMQTLLALHLLGVLKHHLIDRKPVLSRMSPFSKGRYSS